MFATFLLDDRGRGLVEYSLVVALVALVALVSLKALGHRANNTSKSAAAGRS